MSCLAKTALPDGEIHRLIQELDARGFQSESFRVDAARAIEERLKSRVGLSDAICELLERWLADPWPVTEMIPPQEKETDERKPTSVLWQRGGAIALPFGTYHLLHAVTYGYLLRKPPFASRWLTALEARVERTESTRTWQVLSHDLRYLSLCDRERAARFLSRLFERFPEALASEHGAALLMHAWSFVPADLLWQWLAQIRTSPWRKGVQAYGELIALRALVYSEDELLDPEALQEVTPEEEFEGYTGNAGMTLDRWYRHAAILLWPKRRHFDVLCKAGSHAVTLVLAELVKQLQRAGEKDAPALRQEALALAGAIVRQWSGRGSVGFPSEKAESCPLFASLAALDEREVIDAYLGTVLATDSAVDPGSLLAVVCQKHGWNTFQKNLQAVFKATTSATLERNVRLLEHLCLAPRRN